MASKECVKLNFQFSHNCNIYSFLALGNMQVLHKYFLGLPNNTHLPQQHQTLAVPLLNFKIPSIPCKGVILRILSLASPHKD